MPLTGLSGRDVYTPLLILTLILGVIGFSWQSSLYRSMLDRVDAELLLTAKAVASLNRIAQPNQHFSTSPCDSVHELLKDLPNTRHVGIYSSTGQLICATDGNNGSLRIALEQPTPNNPTYTFSSDQGSSRRNLIYPFVTNNQEILYLYLGDGIDQQLTGINRWRSILLAGALALLTMAAFLLRQRVPKPEQPGIAELISAMDRTTLGGPPATVHPAGSCSAETRRLIDSYNQLSERIGIQLQKAGQFAANVAHELRTPLTIMRGETEMALRGRIGQEINSSIRQVLTSNLEEIQRMSYLIDDLLLLSKSDLGEIPLKSVAIRVEDFLAELKRQTEILAREKQIHVELISTSSETIIEADELRLRQALLNLVSNAVRYTQEQGTITISLEPLPSEVKITIADNGIGIDQQHLDRIFERFYRVDKKSDKYGSGSGLGLAIVKWVVDAHQGSISVSSTPHLGSRFVLTLPKTRDKQPTSV